MRTPTRHIPDGYHAVTPHLCVKGLAEAMAFYKNAFGAVARACLDGPDDKPIHGEITIGNCIIMLTEEIPGGDIACPVTIGGTPITFHMYVEDADVAYQRALDAGAECFRPMTDAFWGDRYGIVVDPFGHRWGLASRDEDLPLEEIALRQKQNTPTTH